MLDATHSPKPASPTTWFCLTSPRGERIVADSSHQSLGAAKRVARHVFGQVFYGAAGGQSKNMIPVYSSLAARKYGESAYDFGVGAIALITVWS